MNTQTEKRPEGEEAEREGDRPRAPSINTKRLIQATVGFVVMLGALSAPQLFEKKEPVVIESTAPPEPLPDPFENIALEAQAAYVYDTTTGEVVFSKNGTQQLPLASLTKIMTALVALERNELDAIITIDEEHLNGEGNDGLFAYETWNLTDLLSFTLVESSNDGAKAVAAAFESAIFDEQSTALHPNTFVDAMNAKARNLGLYQTYFLNETGLDATENEASAYGSAEDMARLIVYAATAAPRIFSRTQEESFEVFSLSNLPHTVENTNKLAGRLPGLLASKTGFTDLAGGNLAVLFDAEIGYPVAIAVLGSSLEGRFKDVEVLARASIEKLAQDK